MMIITFLKNSGFFFTYISHYTKLVYLNELAQHFTMKRPIYIKDMIVFFYLAQVPETSLDRKKTHVVLHNNPVWQTRMQSQGSLSYSSLVPHSAS